MSVSTATRLFGSCESRASRMESLIASAILSGWPSVTDSDVNRRRDTSAPYGLGSTRSLVALAHGAAVHLVGGTHARVVHRTRCDGRLRLQHQNCVGHPERPAPDPEGAAVVGLGGTHDQPSLVGAGESVAVGHRAADAEADVT